MKKLQWQIILGVVGLVAVAILVIGNQPISSAVVQEATQGGVYTEGLVGAPSRLNPLLDYYNQVDKDVDRLLFSRLIKFDSFGNPQPDLAESWGVNVRGDVFNLQLRQGINWHDGNPITTEDILFTTTLLKDPEIPLPEDLISLWQSVEVEIFDEYNIQFTLSEPFSPFIDYLGFGVLPKHLFEGKTVQQIIDDPINLAPIGSGPYLFDSLELDPDSGKINEIVLTANEDYYSGRPNLDQIVLRYFDSTEDALTAYQNNQIQGINYIDLNNISQALNLPTLNFYSARLPQSSMILFNLDNGQVPFFQTSQIRRALLTALNRNLMIDEVYQGQALIAHGPILPGTWAYYDQVDKYIYDPAIAVNMFFDAGYSLSPGGNVRTNEDNIDLRFELLHQDSVFHSAIAEMIRDNWSDVGVEVTLIPLELEDLITNFLVPRNYQAALIDLTMMGTPDPDPYSFWHQSQVINGQNFSEWDDRRASEYLERARITPNLQERERLYRNFQIHFSIELPGLPLFFPVYTFGIDEAIKGVQAGPLFDPSDRFNNVADWFILSRPEIEEVLDPTPADN